eukprot:5405076-Amphidinium_carterae.1
MLLRLQLLFGLFGCCWFNCWARSKIQELTENMEAGLTGNLEGFSCEFEHVRLQQQSVLPANYMQSTPTPIAGPMPSTAHITQHTS